MPLRLRKKILSFFAFVAIVISFAACGGKDGNNPEQGQEQEQQEEYVDLGLDSGTRWKTSNTYNPNEEHGFYMRPEAMTAFGDQVPTRKQWEELMYDCDWEWKGNGYEVSGNGKKIFLPAEGMLVSGGTAQLGGYYLSSTADNLGTMIQYLEFNATTNHIILGMAGNRMSLRLVRNAE